MILSIRDTQRMRWAKGFYQVFASYGSKLSKGVFKGKGNHFSCFDMIMTIAPALLLTLLSFTVNGFFFLTGLLLVELEGNTEILVATSTSLIGTLLWIYLMLFILGVITTVSEWNKIYCSGWKKIGYTFTFPLFMLTYIPIAITALYKNVECQPITHNEVKSIDDIR